MRWFLLALGLLVLPACLDDDEPTPDNLPTADGGADASSDASSDDAGE